VRCPNGLLWSLIRGRMLGPLFANHGTCGYGIVHGFREKESGPRSGVCALSAGSPAHGLFDEGRGTNDDVGGFVCRGGFGAADGTRWPIHSADQQLSAGLSRPLLVAVVGFRGRLLCT